MPHSLRAMIPLGVAAGCAVGLLATTRSAPARSTSAVASLDAEVVRLRAQGPAGLDHLLARYDGLQPGAERDALARTIDRVAAQRYATESRLYWYTDLGQAQTAAQTTHRPILALRMLGRLDEELSCANSRLFRSTLYANAQVSKFLRDNFVLYWSSERPVPRVTIDMGDGRTIERTVTGNSAHYVLAADGTVLDVLPGLYAPPMFRDELAKSVTLARRVRELPADQRGAAIAAFHRDGLASRQGAYAKIHGAAYTPGSRTLVSMIRRAQQATMAKAAMEVPVLAAIGIDAGKIDRADVSQWAAIGKYMWNVQPRAEAPATTVFLDARSRSLVAQLHGGASAPAPRRDDLELTIAQLEHRMLADTALNELVLRRQIRQNFVAGKPLAFESLNAWIYAAVFHTPKQDTWLGLVTPGEFTGLPRDGVRVP